MKERIVGGKWIIQSADQPPLYRGAIFIKNDTIVEVGPQSEILRKYSGVERELFEESIIIPGMVNAHTHAPMSIFRGLAEDLSLMTWLHNYIFPIEAKLKREWVYWGSKLSILEMIRSGVTLFCDMYLFEEEVIRAVEEVGIKALLGEGLFDFPSPSYGPLERGLSLTEELLNNFRRHPLIKIAVSPHTLYTCSPETIKKCIHLSEKYEAKLHLHLSENKEEVAEIFKKYGKTPAELLYQLGGMNENLLSAHCVKLSLKEIELMAKYRGSVVHCPESNLKLGSGIAPLPEMIRAGINVALGTDGPASNNDLDIFSEMKTASLIQKGLKEDPTVITAKDVFKAATEAGAKALGFKDTGKLVPGYKADLAVIDLNHHFLQPDYDPLPLIVYTAKAGCVSHLMVNGKWIMKNYRIITLDEEEVRERMKIIKEEILLLVKSS